VSAVVHLDMINREATGEPPESLFEPTGPVIARMNPGPNQQADQAIPKPVWHAFLEDGGRRTWRELACKSARYRDLGDGFLDAKKRHKQNQALHMILILAGIE
jgi:hypothetical protein